MVATTTRRFAHVPAGTGDVYDIIGERLTFKVTQADSAGTFTLVELRAQPGPGVPLHTHASAESFTVLEGQWEFLGLQDGKPYAIRATVGDTVYIPAGDPHGYRVVGDAPGRSLAVLTPGDEMERFFKEAGTLVTDDFVAGPPDFDGMIALANKHGLTFLPPPAD